MTKTVSQDFTILKNPVSETSLADTKAQFDFINEINDKVTEIHQALKNVKKVRSQVSTLKKIDQRQKRNTKS